MQDLIALARNVEKARADLDRAIEALRAATGLSSLPRGRSRTALVNRPRPTTVQAAPGSVSQAVLAAIQSSPTGMARADLLNLGAVGAVHSALKVHKAKGLIENKDGRWIAKGAGQAQGKKKGPEAL